MITTTGTFISIALGLFIIFIGYLVWFKKKLTIIPGYNKLTADKVKDKEGLARLFGILCLVIGIFTMAMPFFVELIGETTASGIFTAVIIGGIVLVIIRVQKL